MENQEIISKVCTKCKQEKTFDQFTKSKYGRYGYNSKCKVCKNDLEMERVNNRLEKIKNGQYIVNIPSLKTCPKCHENKSALAFTRDKKTPDGLYYSCKDCKRKENRDFQRNNKEHVLQTKRTWRANNREREYLNKKQYAEDNKEYISAYKKMYYLANKEKIKTKSNKYYYENLEKCKETMKTNRLKNPNRHKKRNEQVKRDRLLDNYDDGRKYEREFQKRRSKVPQNRLIGSLRQRVNSILKGNKNNRHSFDLIGCSIEFIKSYFESLFLPGMTWENYGKKKGHKTWTHDHIIPCEFFNFDSIDEQKTCFYWKNLRPMWLEENAGKADILPGGLFASDIKHLFKNAYKMNLFSDNPFLLDWGAAMKL